MQYLLKGRVLFASALHSRLQHLCDTWERCTREAQHGTYRLLSQGRVHWAMVFWGAEVRIGRQSDQARSRKSWSDH